MHLSVPGWQLEPGVALGIGVTTALYVGGTIALRRHARFASRVRTWRSASFAGAMLALVIALCSPLDALADELFSVHMVQHLVLILVVAPLLVASEPLLPTLWALPRRTRLALCRWWLRVPRLRGALRGATGPVSALILHSIAIWYWHMPRPYQLALQNDGIHALEHICFLGTAMLFWWPIIQPIGRRRLSYVQSAAFAFVAMMQTGALGALLAFSRTAWYPIHAAGAAAFGMTALDDQQLAGLIMWIPMGIVYALTIAILFVRWMQSDERADGGEQQPPDRTRARQRTPRRLRAISPSIIALAATALTMLTLGACNPFRTSQEQHVVNGGDADRGKDRIVAYGCGSCHDIPGVRGAEGMVGPPLTHWARRKIIAGEVPNTTENLITWITVPQAIEPGSVMPNMGVTDGEARDIAAYLYTLR